ncbi:MAG TPA: AI-2E family transporter, partial [Pseudonocardiaceae bacterium]|nr:AI-2E family transporter [Pseudonocardiaceae bacterium]
RRDPSTAVSPDGTAEPASSAPRSEPERRERVPVRTILVSISLVLATALSLLLIYEIRRVLVWVIIAAFFAVALYPVVNRVERRITWCRRWLATLLVFLLVLVVVGGLVAVFAVPLARQGAAFAAQLPALVADARAGRGPVGELLARVNALEWVQQHQDRIGEFASGLGTSALAFVTSVATAVAAAVTIFILAYLLVLEGPKALSSTLALFPPARAERIRHVGADCAKTITGYLSGNLVISLVCGLLTYAVLAIAGVPFAGLIALFVAIADLIPLVGATLGALVASIAAFIHSVPAGIAVVIFFVVYQQLENHLLQPVILSRTVKLNPLIVLVAILIGVELAGILGALLAIPVAGILQVIVRDIWDHRQGQLKEEPTIGAHKTPLSTVTTEVTDPEIRKTDASPPAKAP